MAKKIVIAVMLIDDEDKNAKSEFYENVSVDASKAAEYGALLQIQTWISEKVVCAKLKADKL